MIFGIGCSFTETNFGIADAEGQDHHPRDARPRPSQQGCRGEDRPGRRCRRWCSTRCWQRLGKTRQGGPRRHARSPPRSRASHKEWLAKWMPKLTSNDAPLNPYRVLWDLQHTVDVDNTIITHDAGSPRDQLSPFWKSAAAAVLYRLGQDHAARLRPGPGDGRQARAARQALHQCLGRCRDRLHRHGFRDRGARAHPDPVDPAEQLLAWRSS